MAGMSDNRLDLKELRRREVILKITTYAVSILITALFLTPFVLMFTTSLEPGQRSELQKLMANPVKRLLKHWNQIVLFFQSDVRINLYNSLIVSFVSTTLCMYVSALTAYSLTAYEWRFKRFLNNFIIGVMMIPTTISAIGYYDMVYAWKMQNHLSMVIFPAIVAPVTVFFMRMYLQSTFSLEIVESARLDGAGEFRIFNSFILPLMKPAIATQAIFCFVKVWYDAYIPAIVLIDSTKRTLPFAFSVYVATPDIITYLPPLLVFAFCSKHIVEGVSLGCVK